ncbi:MAG TPA: O-antigen ligase family protein [Verrucomicrobiae bacterium]|jgi:O-antigen ligase|nr:O-antigen ligase family protein [Verrucomicrobiae bacterium]
MRLPVSDRFADVAFYALAVLWAALAFSPALAEIAFTVAVLAWLVYRLSLRRMPLEGLDRRAALLLLGYVLIVILSYFWSEYPRQSFRGLIKVVKHVMIFVMSADLLTLPSRQKIFEKAAILIFGLIVLNGFYQYLSGSDLLRGFPLQDSKAGPRVSSSFKTYGLFASYLLSWTGYVAAVGSSRFPRFSFYRMAALFIAVAAAVLLFKTRSRGAMLAFAGGVFVMLVLKRKFLILGIFALVLAAGISRLPRTMLIHLDIHEREQSLVERYHLWDRALQVIVAKPLTGTGINTYAQAHQKYDKRKNWRVKNYYAHNGYLQAAAETGLVSLACLLGFWGLLIVDTYRKMRRRPDPGEGWIYDGVFAGVLMFLFFMAVDTVFHNPQSVMSFWFTLGLLYAYANPAGSQDLRHGLPLRPEPPAERT